MKRAQRGDKVQIRYTARLSDGQVVSASPAKHPLQFTVGAEEVLAGVETAVVGMTPGERKHARLAAAEAYGPYRSDLVAEVPRDRLPLGHTVSRGERLVFVRADSRPVSVTVVDVSPDTVTLDGNHPLAGEAILVDLQLVAVTGQTIRPPRRKGRPHVDA